MEAIFDDVLPSIETLEEVLAELDEALGTTTVVQDEEEGSR